MTKFPKKNPHQKRAIATRSRILEATAKLAAENLSMPMTSSDIAKEAGVAVGTLYRYFMNVEEAILEAYDLVLESVNERWFQGLPEMKTMPAPVAARAFFMSYRDCAEQEPSYVPLLSCARKIRPAAVEFALNVDTPESHIAFADIMGIEPSPDHLASVRLLKFITLQLMDLYLTAPKQDQPPIGEEIIRYTEQTLKRLRT